MTHKIAKKILEMEKDKLLLEPESNMDWELITALDIAIEVLKEKLQGKFIINQTKVIKMGEPLSNSDEISKALEKGEFYKRRYSEFVVDLENFLNQYDLTIDSISGSYKPLSLDIRIEERSNENDNKV